MVLYEKKSREINIAYQVMMKGLKAYDHFANFLFFYNLKSEGKSN